ncbi:MAG: Nif3-like dinuclear metal center hexameric protein, partial [Flavobacteriales bacterium]
LQESYDNSGLIVGHPDDEIHGAIICLDSTEAVIDEAIEKKANLVIAHHPIVFSGLKRFNGQTYIERVVMKAIKHGIAIYAIHTNLDNVSNGVNAMICSALNIENPQILSPKKGLLNKLVVFLPEENRAEVKHAMYKAGAGEIGEYSNCSFAQLGTGTFKPGAKSNPHTGSIGDIHSTTEERFEVIVESFSLNSVVSAMLEAHPYEEVAYDVYQLQNKHQNIGSGMIGELGSELAVADFFDTLKNALGVAVVKHTDFTKEKVKRIAVCGGSGSFLLESAIRQKADVFVTSDFKYHQFFDAEGKTIIADIGHYESEHRVMEWLQGLLKQKFTTFAVRLTGVNTNPVHYY